MSQVSLTSPGRHFLAVALLATLAACQAAPRPAPPPPPAAAAAVPAAPAADFTTWLEGVRNEAARRGISQATITAALTGLEPNPRVIDLDHRQPEYNQTFWRYLDNAVTAKRIAQGRELMAQHAALLQRLEKQYGVPPQVLVAFWGMESNYGGDSGGYRVVAALATLAYDGRRAAFFRDELFNALLIIDRGNVSPAAMAGSWAGAMGQTQFMPSTFLKYGVDADGDGRIDIWNDVDDALASAANYLQALGWNHDQTWGREVILPAGFDVGLASIDSAAAETALPLQRWAELGVKAASGTPLVPRDRPAALVLPGGAQGPAFLVTENYRTILKWNRSMLYALAVGDLADRLVGGAAFAAPHGDERPLTRDEMLALQDALRRLGFLKADPDGIVGASTRQALRAFQRAHGLPPDGYADAATVAIVVARAGSAS